MLAKAYLDCCITLMFFLSAPPFRPPFARGRILPPDGRSLLLAWVGAALKVLKGKITSLL